MQIHTAIHSRYQIHPNGSSGPFLVVGDTLFIDLAQAANLRKAIDELFAFAKRQDAVDAAHACTDSVIDDEPCDCDCDTKLHLDAEASLPDQTPCGKAVAS